MESIGFQVSAKTARLIGRENISDVDGAIIELVKNGYDADAECVLIKYSNPYDAIPGELTLSEIKNHLKGDTSVIDKFYEIKDGKYVLRTFDEERTDDSKAWEELNRFFQACSEIIVLDNGCGMSRDVLRTSWMNIGTKDKEVNIYSAEKTRIKTGAKGIGRFALDKLSLCSSVVTKSKDDVTVDWRIDWTQFDNAELLNQVKADINVLNADFVEIVEDILGDDFQLVRNYDWSTGTLIRLHPLREFWNDKLYRKVNANLKNINPLGSVDQFDVFVKNTFHPKLDYKAVREGIDRDDYDYMIDAEYDGKDKIKITLDRNELDIKKEKVVVSYSESDREEYDLNDFWGREAFKREKYQRNDFNGTIELSYSLPEIVPDDGQEYESYKKVGSFTLKIYYVKNTKSTVEIVRDIKSRRRKKLLEDFSGIKIYRDNFKVRPYGDTGQFYDWINLSERVQKSPAAASHESGNWRVSPNQFIGSVAIGRISNPELVDNANREGMSLNREYYAFIDLIQGIIGKFEYDRQFPLREYANWINPKKKEHEKRAQEIYEQVLRERQEKEKQKGEEGRSFTEEELKDAIYTLGRTNEEKLSTQQLLMVLSAAGVMAQTFAHEITRVGTNLGSRGQHLKASIDRILGYMPYAGDEDFNPYDMLQELNSTDELLAEWVNLIMDSVKRDNFDTQSVDLQDFMKHITELWRPLFKKKYIDIYPLECVNSNIKLQMPIVDLHLVINNFMLNSAYYLEEASGNREIRFKLYDDEKHVYLDMINNGPELDSRYRQNPDEVLNARVSSKEGGTGLGLWIAREAMNRNSGELHIMLIKDGFMLRASWLK